MATSGLDLSPCMTPLATRVADDASSEAVTRVVTGDCLATLGTLVGLQRSGLDPALVWFDAHGDVHTVQSSTSGYLGGMALRMALGGDSALLGRPLGLQTLAEDRAVLVDARELDPAEKRYLSQSSLRHTTVDRMSERDLPNGPILQHVDMDVIDKDEVPGLRFPAGKGPTSAQLLNSLDGLIASGRVAALDIACPWFEPGSDAESDQRIELLGKVLSRAE
jgi:arginase